MHCKCLCILLAWSPNSLTICHTYIHICFEESDQTKGNYRFATVTLKYATCVTCVKGVFAQNCNRFSVVCAEALHSRDRKKKPRQLVIDIYNTHSSLAHFHTNSLSLSLSPSLYG